MKRARSNQSVYSKSAVVFVAVSQLIYLLPNRGEETQNVSAFINVRASSRYAADFLFILYLVCLGSVLLPPSIHRPECEVEITSDTSVIHEGILP